MTSSKPVAALILNRNLPEITNELGDWILEQSREVVDLYVIENGSDVDKRSKYANIIFPESLGPARGINEALQQLLAQGYEYFWVSYNDARYDQADFLSRALKYLQANPQLGIFFPHWTNNMWLWGRQAGLAQVCFTDLLGFIVTRKALQALAQAPGFKFEPLWDSSNYSNHFNIMATLLALYKEGFWAATDRKLTVFELVEPAATESVLARGFSDAAWKNDIGPKETREWLARAFPQYHGTAKQIRERVVLDIQHQIVQRWPRSVSFDQYIGHHFQYWRQLLIHR